MAVPANWSMVRVYGQLTDDDNDPLLGYTLRAVSTAPRLQDTISNRVMLPEENVITPSVTDGYFYWDQLSDTDTDVTPLPRQTKITLLRGTTEVQSWWVTVNHSLATQTRFDAVTGAVVTSGGVQMDAVKLTSLEVFSSQPPDTGRTIAAALAALRAEPDPFTQYATNDELTAGLASVVADLPESSAGLYSAPAGTPTDLLGKISEFTGTVTQPMPAATPGRVLAFRQRTTGLTLQRAGSDVFVIGDGTSQNTLSPSLPGELIGLHCTVAGQWRVTSSHKPQAALAQVFAPSNGPNPLFFECYKTFFTEGWTFVTGQGNTGTTLSSAAASGATTLQVASGTGLIDGTVLLVNAGTAQQKQHKITSGGGTTTLTITPALASALTSGAAVTPLWADGTHLTNPAGWSSFATWVMSRTKADGTRLIGNPGTKPIVFFGNSWMLPAYSGSYAAAVNAVYPSATVTMAGVNGNTSTQLLARFDSDVPSNAAYVIFNEPGVNALVYGESRAIQQANLEAIIAKCRAIGAVPVFLGMPPLMQFPAESKAANLAHAQALSAPIQFPATSVAALDDRYQQRTPSGSTAYGVGALGKDTNGSNTAVGQGALGANTSGSGNTAVGQYALTTSLGSDNTAVGQGSLANATGAENTALGTRAAAAITTGTWNTAVGVNALNTATSASGVTAVGRAALRLATGSANTAVGREAATKVTTGTGHVVIGANAGADPNYVGANGTTTANNQTLLGAYSGQSSATQVDDVVAVGSFALVGGKGATAIGSGASAPFPGSVAIGRDSSDGKAIATSANDFALGTANHTVRVPGRLNILSRTPTGSADAQGSVGDMAWDDGYVYVKTSGGWKRSALTTF